MWTRNAKRLVALSAAFYLIALLNDAAAVYVLWLTAVGLLVVGYAMARRALRGFSVTRAAQTDRVFQYQPLSLTVALTHPRGVAQLVTVSDPITSLTRGTVEDTRCLVQATPEATRDELSRDISFPLRGHYRLGPLVMHGSDPLGLFVRSATIEQSVEIVVYPRPLPLPHLYLQGLSAYRLSELRMSPLAGTTQEFYGIRPYQHGDDLRRVHWKSTARTGRLAVKEYEQRLSSAATIVLDLHRASQRGAGAQSTLEYAVTIAASLAQHVTDAGHSLSLVTTGADSFFLPMDHGSHQMRKALEHLAVARADGTMGLAAALAVRMTDIAVASTVFVITPSADAHLAQALLRLRAGGSHVTAVLLDAPSFGDHPEADLESAYAQLLGAAFGATDAVCPVRRGDDIASALGAARLWL